MRFFLELFGVMIMIQAIVLPGRVVGSYKVADMQLNFWREKLPSVQVPETVAASMSPLTEEEVGKFTKIIKDRNLRYHATQFCNSANLLCDQSVHVVRPTITNYFLHSDYESDEMNNIFFAAEELREGGKMTLPDLYRPWKAFLPRNLSQLMPFSTATLSDVLSSFGISDASNLALNMEMTLTECEAKPGEGEIKACTTSFEGMIEYLLSKSGSSDGVELFHHNVLTADSGKKAKISKVERLSGPSDRPPLVCHRFAYPYGVFYCHSINGTLTFTMELEVMDTTKNNYQANAVCHPNMSNKWNKGSHYCHMVFGDSLLWLIKEKH